MAMIGLEIGANAQNLTFGAKVGYNVAGITNMDDLDAPSDIISFNAGAFAEWRFNRFFGFAPEIVYSRQGALVGAVLTGPGDCSATVNLDYINVPALARLYPVRWLSMDIGPQVGFLVSANTRKGDYGTKNSKDNFNGVDLSLAMGLTFNLGKHIFLQGRYNMGLTDITRVITSSGTIFGIGNDEKHTNSVVQIGLGCRFGSDFSRAAR